MTIRDLPRSGDAEAVLSAARQWAPYGGVPDEEIFVLFGTSKTRFVEMLWGAVSNTRCDQELVRLLEEIYPRRGIRSRSCHASTPV